MRSEWNQWMRKRSGLVLLLGMCACSAPESADIQPAGQGMPAGGVVGAQAPGQMPPAGTAPQAGLPPGNPASMPMPGQASQNLTPNSEQIKLSGKVTLPPNAPGGSVQIDINRTAAGGGSAPSPLYSVRLPAGGPFEALIPKGVGSVMLMLYVGVQNTDPGSVGPENTYSWGPLEVSDVSVSDINIDLTAAPPMTANAAGVQGNADGVGAGGANPGGVPQPLPAQGAAPAPAGTGDKREGQ